MTREISRKKTPVAVTSVKARILLFSVVLENGSQYLVYNTSLDGSTFSKTERMIHIGVKGSIQGDLLYAKAFSSNDGVLLSLVIEKDGVIIHNTLSSTDLKKWKMSKAAPLYGHTPIIVSKGKTMKPIAAYFSHKAIWVALAEKKKNWSPARIIAFPRVDSFDSEFIRIVAVMPTSAGILVIYDSQSYPGDRPEVSLGALLCSTEEPDKVLWRTSDPLWRSAFNKTRNLTPMGAGVLKKKVYVYWKNDAGEIISIKIDYSVVDPRIPFDVTHLPLKRSEENPIIIPIEDGSWQQQGTFNPAAFEDDDGRIHLLYRAIGADGISRIGHAVSDDAIHFRYRSPAPVYEMGHSLDMLAKSVSRPLLYSPSLYTSGGSWGGTEDPRTVRIGNKIYMLYVAFEGWDSVRMALTSISLSDVKKKNWRWRKAKFISPPGQVNKNWLIFPEKIHGKYAILHSIAPKILIQYVDNIETFNDYIDSPRPSGPQPGREHFWDNLLKGAGPPPLRIKDGWLLLYHALDKRDSHKYKLGAMILDHHDPTKILYRAAEPVLEPKMVYENEGKPGVVYASGAVIKGGELYIYYGGGDRVVCVAHAPLDEFIHHIKTHRKPRFHYITLDIT